MSLKVAITGVGNCASALVQGVHLYRNVKSSDEIPGVMHARFGEYHINDIEFVAAFDVNTAKIGKDLSEAIWAPPNNCARFAEMPRTGVKVLPGPILDGVAPHMKERFRVAENHAPVDVAEALRESEADILVNLLPVGSARATEAYAEATLEAGCGFVNCIPEFIASDPAWARRFRKKGVPVAGDDIKSQLGATITHRSLVQLFRERGIKVDSTYQLNIGGNTDFENMQYEERLATKRVSKTEAVTSVVPYAVPTRIGPSDYIPHLEDQKIAYIEIEGHGFGNLPVKVDLKMKVNDSPNSAGIIIDVVRGVKTAMDRGLAGPIESISAYAFKHPPRQVDDDVARDWVEDFIKGRRSR